MFKRALVLGTLGNSMVARRVAKVSLARLWEGMGLGLFVRRFIAV